MLFVLLISSLSAVNAMTFREFFDKYSELELAGGKPSSYLDHAERQAQSQSPNNVADIAQIMNTAAGVWGQVAESFAGSTEPLLQAIKQKATGLPATIGQVRDNLVLQLQEPLTKIFASQNQLNSILYKVFIRSIQKQCKDVTPVTEDDDDNDNDDPYFYDLLSKLSICVDKLWEKYEALAVKDDAVADEVWKKITDGSTTMILLGDLVRDLESGPLEEKTLPELWKEIV